MFFSRFSRPTGYELRNDHIFHRGKFRQKMVVLVNETDVLTPLCRSGFIGETATGFTGQENITIIRLFEQTSDVEQG